VGVRLRRYEAAAALDPGLAVHRVPAGGPPLLWFGLSDEPVPAGRLDAPDVLASRSCRCTQSPSGPSEGGVGYTVSWDRAWTVSAYHRDVARVRESIAQGETYQCNLTVRMRGQFAGAPLAMYSDLALSQRGAYNAYLDLGRFAVASASPELFFERTGDDLLLRPMKGTAPRGRTLVEDEQQATVLRASAEERAENVMIVDLVRNDVARIAQVGSVRVPELLRTERYETVVQLTSDVVARLRSGVGLTELLRALFPSGSVTGAPKASTMRLIRELESTPRGVYCGAVGFVGPPDARVRARFNVANRTAVIDRGSGTAVYGTGSGITWSSDARAEHDEVLTKTAVLDHRPRRFDLVETMRHDPERGLRNRDRHLRRLADSAAHFGFRFDLALVMHELRCFPHGDDVVMVNERAELTEATRANIAVRLDGWWWTPPLRSGCLPGVERGRLIDRGTLAERVLDVADLQRAEEIAVISSLRGWRAAWREYPRIGEVGPPRRARRRCGW